MPVVCQSSDQPEIHVGKQGARRCGLSHGRRCLRSLKGRPVRARSHLRGCVALDDGQVTGARCNAAQLPRDGDGLGAACLAWVWPKPAPQEGCAAELRNLHVWLRENNNPSMTDGLLEHVDRRQLEILLLLVDGLQLRLALAERAQASRLSLFNCRCRTRECCRAARLDTLLHLVDGALEVAAGGLLLDQLLPAGRWACSGAEMEPGLVFLQLGARPLLARLTLDGLLISRCLDWRFRLQPTARRCAAQNRAAVRPVAQLEAAGADLVVGSRHVEFAVLAAAHVSCGGSWAASDPLLMLTAMVHFAPSRRTPRHEPKSAQSPANRQVTAGPP